MYVYMFQNFRSLKYKIASLSQAKASDYKLIWFWKLTLELKHLWALATTNLSRHSFYFWMRLRLTRNGPGVTSFFLPFFSFYARIMYFTYHYWDVGIKKDKAEAVFVADAKPNALQFQCIVGFPIPFTP